jgi:hypothetical protein
MDPETYYEKAQGQGPPEISHSKIGVLTFSVPGSSFLSSPAASAPPSLRHVVSQVALAVGRERAALGVSDGRSGAVGRRRLFSLTTCSKFVVMGRERV